MKLEIETHLLRYLLMYYGNVGLQLRRVSLRNRASCLNLIYNLFVIGVWSYFAIVFSQRDPWPTAKPIFRMAAQCFMKGTPVSYFIIMLYFMKRGHRIAELLDSACFHQASPTKQRSKRIILFIIFIDYCLFVIIFKEQLSNLYWHPVPFNIAALFSTYTYHTNPIIIMGMLHYYKLATYRALGAIEDKVHINSIRFLDEVRQLARVNSQLSEVMSFPVMLTLANNTIDIIVTMCRTLLFRVDLDNITYMLMFSGHLLYITLLDRLILSRFRRISHQLMVTLASEEKMFTIRYRYSSTILHHRASNESMVIRLREVHIYEHYFSLQLFSLCHLNVVFVFGVALFILNYVVLITQTQ